MSMGGKTKEKQAPFAARRDDPLRRPEERENARNPLAESADAESSDEHSGPLTEKYIRDALRDVRTKWQCFEALCTLWS